MGSFGRWTAYSSLGRTIRGFFFATNAISAVCLLVSYHFVASDASLPLCHVRCVVGAATGSVRGARRAFALCRRRSYHGGRGRDRHRERGSGHLVDSSREPMCHLLSLSPFSLSNSVFSSQWLLWSSLLCSSSAASLASCFDTTFVFRKLHSSTLQLLRHNPLQLKMLTSLRELYGGSYVSVTEAWDDLQSNVSLLSLLITIPAFSSTAAE